MTVKSRADLHTEYEVIRNEVAIGLNSRSRIANAYQNTLDSVALDADLTSHTSDTANPHATSIANIGSGTLAQLNLAISDDNAIGSSEKGTANGVATLDASANLDLTGKNVTTSATTSDGLVLNRTAADSGSDGAPVTLASLTVLENKVYLCKCWVRAENASTGAITVDAQFTVKLYRNTGGVPTAYGTTVTVSADPSTASVTVSYNFGATTFYVTKQNDSTTAMKWSSQIVWTSDTKL